MNLGETGAMNSEVHSVVLVHQRLVKRQMTTMSWRCSLAKFDRFADLEDHVMDHLLSVTDLKVFGCSIECLHLATQTYLEDPIWDRLQQSMEYCIIQGLQSPALAETPRRVSH